MEEIKETKKGGSNVALILAILVILCLVGYICYDKVLAPTSSSESSASSQSEKSVGTTKTADKSSGECNCNTEETTTKTIEECNAKPSKSKCYGTYYVNGEQSEGTYIFNEDGTWKVVNSEQGGVFTINENTITMIESKHTVGPREEDPYYYNPKSYLISDDCSNIRLYESGSHTGASLEKAN